MDGSFSLEERNHSDQGAQREDQDAEGRDGADVAQIVVAAGGLAENVLVSFPLFIATIYIGLARVPVRTGPVNDVLSADCSERFGALVEARCTFLLPSFSVAAIIALVALDRVSWMDSEIYSVESTTTWCTSTRARIIQRPRNTG